MKKFILLFLLFGVFGCEGQTKKETDAVIISKTDAEWKAELTDLEYRVLRGKETERAFTGKYWNTFDKGKYVCAACGNVIFDSSSKFDSDCGWPSFDQAIRGSVIYADDHGFGMTRIEVLCAECGGHLGHLFDDGPKETTGKRFCTNSASIKFISEK